ncbi:MAG: hypothetical protein JWL62_2221 [Hyphomicrobiales bacterium]|nr:hypothetical protein [Hyphomicrobiales bacterium]
MLTWNTSGITSQGEEFQRQVLALVRTFDAFDVENDPYQEHDFGSLLVEDLRVLFKIDYYDPSREAASSDPADATDTQRVMTIMLADEY